MDDFRVGSALRAVRIRANLRQDDLALRAGVGQTTISDIELGRLDGTTIATLRRVARALDVRISVTARWRGGELDRLLNVRHATLASAVTMHLQLLGWEVSPEVSFAVYGERGSIDVLAWHPSTRSLLVVEVKSELVDIHDTLTVLDRKNRLAAQIARERGWPSRIVATWLVLAEGSTNRHRVKSVEPLIRTALPAGGPAMKAWLVQPAGSIAGLTFFSITAGSGPKHETTGRQRVRPARKRTTERGFRTFNP